MSVGPTGNTQNGSTSGVDDVGAAAPPPPAAPPAEDEAPPAAQSAGPNPNSSRWYANQLANRFAADVGGAPNAPPPASREATLQKIMNEPYTSTDADDYVRDALRDDPGILGDATVEQKAHMLKSCLDGYVSDEDKQAIATILKSARNPAELQKMVDLSKGVENPYEYLPKTVSKESVEAAAAANASAATQKEAAGVLQKADDAMKAGNYAEARAQLQKLQQPPLKDVQRNFLDGAKGLERRPAEDGADYHDYKTGQNDTKVKTEKVGGGETSESYFDSTYDAAAKTRLAQVDQLEKMSGVLGHPVDPHNLADVKEYFQKFAAGKSADQIRAEYQTYAHDFYVHPGGVDWDKGVPPNDRPGKLEQLFADQPVDATGRKLTDCEGYTYMAQAVLGGIKDAKGQPRFDFDYASNGAHIVVGVFERGKPPTSGFVVNNDSATAFSPKQVETYDNVMRNNRGKPATTADRERHLMWTVPEMNGARTGPRPGDTDPVTRKKLGT
jgi:hypothetical protein